ncbi:B12-binding domain-containing radical SAM protein [Myxococcota bacterium]|nr:B12-binding domain-containing radical SAM protein [Myxococcota bacterium]
MILPALTEATSPFWRPIKYSLFPPLGLATLAAHLEPDLEISLQDEHVERLDLEDEPDLVVIQVYITNAYRAYAIADHYRAKGAWVVLGGLHVTSLPDEAAPHADTIFLGPGDHTFAEFLRDFAEGAPRSRYVSSIRTLEGIPPIRRDLIERGRYLVPNSIVVTRGCPHHCTFCYKDAFFEGGRSFYTQKVDDALAEIDRLPGRHLYFLDDHLLGHPHFARRLFRGMRGMGRIFQAAATVDSILRDDLIEDAAAAGLRSLFVGFETLSSTNLEGTGKRQNLGRSYAAVVKRLESLGVMINGSFVFGLDGDDEDVFARTVDWAVESGITTATFHILTPYPGTALYTEMVARNRLVTTDWDLYDTRHVVYRPLGLSPERLRQGYEEAYESFYRWSSIYRAASAHATTRHRLKHFFYSAGWKKFERAWHTVIRIQQLAQMRPALEAVLAPAARPAAIPLSRSART